MRIHELPLCLTLAAVLWLGLRAPCAPATPVAVEGLSKQQFAALPADQIVTFQGRSLTKTQFLTELQQKAKLAISRRSRLADFAARGKAFLQKEKARIEAKNVALQGLIKRPGPNLDLSALKGCATPTINAVEGGTPAEPGVEFIIMGCGFGAPVKYYGVDVLPTGSDIRIYRVGGGSEQMPVKFGEPWTPTKIVARVPATWGWTDGPAEIKVSYAGKTSNAWPVQFKAERGYKIVRWGQATRELCYQGGQHTCGQGRCTHDNGSLFFNCGTDRLPPLDLRNSWLVDDISLDWRLLYPGGKGSGAGVVGFANLEGFTPGVHTPNPNLRVGWTVIEGYIGWDMLVSIVGPRGTDYGPGFYEVE